MYTYSGVCFLIEAHRVLFLLTRTCSSRGAPKSSSMDTEQELTSVPVAEALSSVQSKRKRSRSSDGDTGNSPFLAKKKTLPNGEAVDSVATTEAKREALVEKVVMFEEVL